MRTPFSLVWKSAVRGRGERRSYRLVAFSLTDWKNVSSQLAQQTNSGEMGGGGAGERRGGGGVTFNVTNSYFQQSIVLLPSPGPSLQGEIGMFEVGGENEEEGGGRGGKRSGPLLVALR